MKSLTRLSHAAMATEFQITFSDPDIDPVEARSVAAALFSEIDRLEDELSRFRPTSDIWRINGLRQGETAYVDYAALDCLMLARAVHDETQGAFDVTVAPLLKCWRNPDGSPRTPSEPELAAARASTGMEKITINPEQMSVTARSHHVQLDLGAVGKGYALDQCVRLLEEQGISGALINAGSSTLLAWGKPPTDEGWPVHVAVKEPRTLCLDNSALSCSGFDIQGAHIIDPRTGRPVPVQDHRWYVQAPAAALSDALSTAFVVMSQGERQCLLERFPGVSFIQ